VRGGLFHYGGPVDSTGFMSSPVEDVTDFPSWASYKSTS
jgi:hypothetical protein